MGEISLGCNKLIQGLLKYALFLIYAFWSYGNGLLLRSVVSTSTHGSTNTYTVTRLLNDGDSNDYIITNGTNNMIYAWGSGTLSDHGPNFAAFSIDLDLSSGSIQITGGEIIYDNTDTVNHGILWYVAWGWISFFLILTGRYAKYFYFGRAILHIVFAIAILLLTLIAVYSYDDITTYSTTSSFLGKKHKDLGTALIFFYELSRSYLGLLQRHQLYYAETPQNG